MPSYFVVDTPEQFRETKEFQAYQDSEDFFIAVFTHHAKDPEPYGWRWHKWGEYLGKGDPQCEYLGDEAGFENGVYSVSIRPHPESSKKYDDIRKAFYDSRS